MIIEICANSFASAQAAQNAGAHRIELCTQLSVGGLTPSYGLIEKVVQELDIAVHVLIRPRAGDFVYTIEELDIMKRDIAFCAKKGCAGVVSGVLTSTSELNVPATQELIEASGGLEFTFHRAFDVVVNPSETLKELQAVGVTRVLSSGQQSKAIDGIVLLKKIRNISEAIQIMPGSGINRNNVLAFQEAGFKMIHFSAISKEIVPESTKAVSFLAGIEGTSDEAEIRKMIAMLG
ncbi:MAG: copper homeostasis protein [Patiriisocius sp.]|jgi:copper homeostasis protein